MKRTIKLATLLLVLTLGAFALAQSVAEAARAAKAEKKASPSAKVYTNDDFDTPARAANPDETSGEKTPSETPDGKASVANATEKTPADAAKEEKSTKADDTSDKDDKASAAKPDEWKKKLDDQKMQIADLERELSLMEREHQVKVSVYYADAGSQLRDSKKWFEEEKQYETDHAAKQKGLADARQKLDDLKDQARKAGVPSNQLD